MGRESWTPSARYRCTRKRTPFRAHIDVVVFHGKDADVALLQVSCQIPVNTVCGEKQGRLSAAMPRWG